MARSDVLQATIWAVVAFLILLVSSPIRHLKSAHTGQVREHITIPGRRAYPPQNFTPSVDDLYAGCLSRARNASQLKQWDDAYAGSLEALRVKPGSQEAASLRDLVLSNMRSDKQYFGAQFEKLRSFRTADSPIRNMDFNEDGTLLTIRHTDAFARVCNFYTGQLVRTYALNTNVFSTDLDVRLNFERRSIDGARIARVKSGILGNEITILDVRSGSTISSRTLWGGEVEVSPDMRTVVVVGGTLFQRRLEFIDMETGNEIRRIQMEPGPTPRFSPDGSWLAVGYQDGRVDIWGVAGRSQNETTLRTSAVGDATEQFRVNASPQSPAPSPDATSADRPNRLGAGKIRPRPSFAGVWSGPVRATSSVSGRHAMFNVRLHVDEASHSARMWSDNDREYVVLSVTSQTANKLQLRGRLPRKPATQTITMDMRDSGEADATFRLDADNGGWAVLKGKLAKQQ
jgi:WD40 repeat protein